MCVLIKLLFYYSNCQVQVKYSIKRQEDHYHCSFPLVIAMTHTAHSDQHLSFTEPKQVTFLVKGFFSLQQLKNPSKSEILEIPFGLNMSSIIHGLLPPFDCFYKQNISQN